MVSYYDELEVEDFTWDEDAKVFHYPCPCGDRFEISKGQLRDGEEIATCPSCSLIVRVIYDYVSAPELSCDANKEQLDWEDYESSDEEEEAGAEEAETPATTAPSSPSNVNSVDKVDTPADLASALEKVSVSEGDRDSS